MLNTKKRISLKAYATVLISFFASQSKLLLAAWPNNAFEAKEVGHAINEITEGKTLEESSEIDIKAPDIAENGAVVPVTVSTTLTDVTKISILVENNPNPLTSTFNINNQLDPFVSTRVKMASTSDITAIVFTKEHMFFAKRNIKVTIGGCGG